MGRGKFVAAFLLASGLAWLNAPAALADDAVPLSEAETALFKTDHLKQVDRPETLEYKFQQSAPGGTGYTDRVTLTVKQVNEDGSKSIYPDFLTGPHHVEYSPVLHATGNPLLLCFLDREVSQLSAVTGGSKLYFQKRIRMGFVDKMTRQDVTITYDGKSVPAVAYTMTPFVGDEMISRFPDVAAKSYQFVLSDAVPGMIYQIKAMTPKLTEDATFASVKQ
jgi:hypothetical protein